MKRDDSSKKEEFYWLFFIDGCVFEFIKIFTNFFKANKICVVFDSTQNYIAVVVTIMLAILSFRF